MQSISDYISIISLRTSESIFLISPELRNDELFYKETEQVREQRNNEPNSKTWISSGQQRWELAMKQCYAKLATTLHHPKMEEMWHDLHALYSNESVTQEELRQGQEELLGAPLNAGHDLEDLVGAYGHLMGQYMIDNVSSPACLDWLDNTQHVALMFAIAESARKVSIVFGDEAKMSPTVVLACEEFYRGVGFAEDDCPVYGVAASPQDVLDFCKKALREDKTWENGMRDFISLQYRGTVLYSASQMLASNDKSSLVHAEWATRFIAMADDEWNVTKSKQYRQYGCSFQPSFRLGIMAAELDTVKEVGNISTGQRDYEKEWKLVSDIVALEKSMDIDCECKIQNRALFDAIFRRKPCASAHATAAECLLKLSAGASDDECDKIMKQLGGDGEGGLPRLHAAVAKQFHLAATTELHDDGATHQFWWGCAASMVRAGALKGDDKSSGYCLGEFRHAIRMAKASKRVRDTDFIDDFDFAEIVGKHFELQARAVERHFRRQADSLMLPQVEHRRGPRKTISLFIEDVCILRNLKQKL